MKWFGEWRGPNCEAEGKIATPVGFVCPWCAEATVMTDNGVMLSDWRDDEPVQVIHRECFRRMLLGSIAHIERRCSCSVPGSTESDPPEMTKREAAKLVDDWAERNRHWRQKEV